MQCRPHHHPLTPQTSRQHISLAATPALSTSKFSLRCVGRCKSIALGQIIDRALTSAGQRSFSRAIPGPLRSRAARHDTAPIRSLLRQSTGPHGGGQITLHIRRTASPNRGLQVSISPLLRPPLMSRCSLPVPVPSSQYLLPSLSNCRLPSLFLSPPPSTPLSSLTPAPLRPVALNNMLRPLSSSRAQRGLSQLQPKRLHKAVYGQFGVGSGAYW